MAQPESRSPDAAPRSGRFLIIADDVTGAMDTGVQFARRGCPTTWLLDPAPADEIQVAAVSTESRELPPAEAAERTKRMARWAADRTCYKKLDSTLRGNPGAEIEALLAALGLKKALVAPAYPENGRVLRHGTLFIDGRRMSEAGFSGGRAGPATDHLPTLLASQCGLPVAHLSEALVAQGVEAVLEASRAHAEGILVADARSRADLDTLAAAWHAGAAGLACGSAGLAGSIAGLIRPEAMIDALPDHACRRVLVVMGSRHRAALAQLRHALQSGLVERAAARLSEDGGGARFAFEAGHPGDRKARALVISASDSDCQHLPEEAVAAVVAARAAELAVAWRPAGLVLVGGATTQAVCRALGIASIRIVREIMPGVALGLGSSVELGQLWVITKAGGFGAAEALVKILEDLAGGEDA